MCHKGRKGVSAEMGSPRDLLREDPSPPASVVEAEGEASPWWLLGGTGVASVAGGKAAVCQSLSSRLAVK